MNTDEVIKKKRGRKPKNIQSVEAINDNIIITANQIHTENVHVLITENVLTYTDSSGTDISSVAESLAESLTFPSLINPRAAQCSIIVSRYVKVEHYPR